MNSYPRELLVQLAPIMFVAGLDVPPDQAPSQVPSFPQPQLPTVPSVKPQDPFTVLTLRLREALLAQRKVAIWQPEKTKAFQVLFVDKEARFPPRKTALPEDPQYSNAHSPLSPLTPTSPLHPDGLIAPIWIRKHTTLVPSVFVLFRRIFEFPLHDSRSPLDTPDLDHGQEERKHDTELAAEVAARKKITSERGVKLTLVLLATRRMLDDPALDTRLTYIRRQSGLDSRAALFVLSPVSPAELGDFVQSLQQALYDPALDYYTAHSKRVRRKRNRHSQAVSTYLMPTSPLGSNPIVRPLRPEGWTVRYEYKMACFAEFRGEDEVALKHYQDAYATLVIMFGSTAILPPRTKRWAEAKVLADCINIKVTKLYLYNNEHALALSHHNTHMRKFGDFSRGWGIGEETFEFWSWIARQHRVLAELLEQGMRSTLTLPVHKPVHPPSVAVPLAASQVHSSSARGTTGLEVDALRALSLNPSHALQHPGFYFYMAARCTEMRRERFLAVVDAELNQQMVSTSPGLGNEKKVDHLIIILELYTKSYELFKKHAPVGAKGHNQSRLTFWIAYRIAQTYYDSGKFDMAVRFFERIAKIYRREKWGPILRPLLLTWYACAQQLGDVELSIRLLIEMLGHGGAEGDDPSSIEEDLLAVLRSAFPSSDQEVLTVDLSESQPIFDSNVVFWAPEVKVGEPTAFQLLLKAPTNVSISSLPIASLAIHISGGPRSVLIVHSSDADSPASGMIHRTDIGHVPISDQDSEDPVQITANLCWEPGATLVFTGLLSSNVPASLQVSKLVMTIKKSSWRIDIPFEPCSSRPGSVDVPRWLISPDPPKFVAINRENSSSVSVRYRPHNVAMSVSHRPPSYLNEDYPIDIEVTNADDRELDIVVDVLLQPTEIDNAIHSIRIGDEHSMGLIKGIPFGSLAPGVTVVKTLFLSCRGAAGDRVLDISAQSRPTDTVIGESTTETTEFLDVSETLQTLVIPTSDPFKTSFNVVYRRSLASPAPLANLKTFQCDYWNDNKGGEALVTVAVECVGPWALDVESMKLTRQDNDQAKVLDCFSGSSGEDTFIGEYLPGDEFSDTCRISLAPIDDQDPEQDAIQGPGEYEIQWRKVYNNKEHGTLSTTTIPLPSLRPPTEELVALLMVPPTAKLHTPFPLRLCIRNHHPSRSANIIVQIDPDPSDGFVVAGLRNGRIPVLLPGAEENLVWKLIPIECGHVKVPRIKVIDRRKTMTSVQAPGGSSPEGELDRDEVKVLDVRYDKRGEPAIDEQTKETSKHSALKETCLTIMVLS